MTVIRNCVTATDETYGHGRHAERFRTGRVPYIDYTPVRWRYPRSDDPVALVIAASCPLATRRYELCVTEDGEYLIRRTVRLVKGRDVRHTVRREHLPEPMRKLYEDLMDGTTE
uniref:hypothetical protein n=1 Tax=Amycolatopsis sp. CA-096443 TaxID=3239919 RepID=UPI003F492DF3